MNACKSRTVTAFLAALFLFLVSLIAIPAQASAVSDEGSLKQRISDAAASPTTVEVDGTIELTEQLVIPAGADITLMPASAADTTLTWAGSSAPSMVKVEEGGNLTLSGNAGGKVVITAAQAAIRLLDVAGSATLNDGLLTGMKGDPGTSGLLGDEPRAAVTVFGAGNMTMNGGAIAANNIGAGGNNIQETAANLAVFGGGAFTLNGGEIRDGKSYPEHSVFYAAGGVGLYGKADFTMTGGKITGNEGGSSGGIAINAGSLYWDNPGDRDRWTSDDLGVKVRIEGGEISNNNGYFYGGGIGGFGKFDITMTGGTIANNHAQFHGGGVHVQDYYVTGDYDEGAGGWKPGPGKTLGYTLEEWKQIVPASFTMSGGTISGNTTGSSGGGINIVSDSVTLTGGTITDNSVSGWKGMGGGVYVSSQPYTLQLANVIFDANRALEGAAIWNCPTGQTRVNITDGAAFAANDAQRYGRDLQVTPFGAGASGPPMQLQLPARQLGGGALDWYIDGYDNRKPLYNEDYNTIRFTDPETGTLVDVAALAENPRYLGTAAHAPQGAEQARSLAKLHLRDNYAQLGGGLGTNGNVMIGTEDELIDVKVIKSWDGDNPPASLEVVLQADGTPIDSAELSAENNWEHVFTGLPKTADGKLINYSVAEAATPGWTTVVSDPVSAADLDNGTTPALTITLTNSQLVELKVTKTWVAGGHDLPESIEVTLLGNGEPVATATLTAANNWQYVFTDLPAKADGKPITYTIAEGELPGWQSVISDPVSGTDLRPEIGADDAADITVTNTKLTELKVAKTWDGRDIPNSLEVTLLADGEPVATALLDAENNWQHVFTDLPVAADGKVIEYSIAEADTPGWTTIISDPVAASELPTTIGADDEATITLTNAELVQLKVEKVWHTGEADLPESIEAILLANGEHVEAVTLNAANNWQHIFTDLPAKANGEPIEYSISENDLVGWQSTVSAPIAGPDLRPEIGNDDAADITITNTQLAALKVLKVWDGNDVPASLDVHLLANGEPVATATLNAENNWQHVFTDLPVVKDGKPIEYSIAEADTPGWTTVISAPVMGDDLPVAIGAEDAATITLTNSELVQLTVLKQWHAADAELPASLQVHLLANGEPVETATLSAANNWQHVFTDLPAKANGKAIVYSIAEEEVDGWIGTVSKAISGPELPTTGTEASEADITLINTELVAITGTKVWVGGNGPRPDVELQLFRQVGDDTPIAVGSPKVLTDGQSEARWEDLPATNAAGERYTYSVDEVNVPEGYDKRRVDDVTVENTYMPPPPTETPTPPTQTPTPPTETPTPPADTPTPPSEEPTPPSETPGTPPEDPEIPITGANAGVVALFAGGLLVAGGVLLIRRRIA